MGNFQACERDAIAIYFIQRNAMHTLAELARIIKAELIGDPRAVVRRAQAFEYAGEGDITLASDARYRARINESAATAIIVAGRIDHANRNLLIAANPKLAFARAIEALHARAYTSLGISNDLVTGEGAEIGKDVSIHARVTIGRNSRIGNRVTLHPGVVIGDDCRVGDDSVIYANV
jgi:UDP-3-O-[3-hydroxymyristoyl] glucosamine N-acyltransferase